MAKRILTISTYPIDNPQHGGQKRVAAIVDEYRKAGHKAIHTAICIDYFYPNISSKDNIVISWSRYHHLPVAAVIGDLLLSNVLSEDDAARDKFVKIIRQFKPDIIEVEQAFLYKTIRNAVDSISWGGMLVNSTQNIETHLKRQILENSTPLSAHDIDDIIDRIDSLERFAAKDADWTVACTDHDAKILKSMGAKEVLVAPNGIAREKINHQVVDKLKRQFRADGVKKVILYIGSAHPPNLTGYKTMVGEKVGFLDSDTRLVVVGGVADMVYGYAQQLPNYIKAVYLNNIVLMGRVEEDVLTALLNISQQIILPLTEGGGSNLKTAEAILADKQVVGTTKAFHSYEKYMKLPNLVVTDSSDEFRQAMDNFLHTDKKQRTAAESKLAEGVLWKSTLKQMIERVNK